MKRTEKLPRMLLQSIGYLVLSLAVLVTNGQAQTVTDTDADGFLENQSITLINGTVVPICPAGSADDAALCLSAAAPDIFVVVVPIAGGRLQNLADPLRVLRGLDRPGTVTGVHQLTAAQVNTARQISLSSTQKAIRVAEDLGLKGSKTNRDGVWGSSTKQGTPNTFGGGVAKVFTAQMAADITAHYAPQPVPAGKIDDCIRHTIAHEAGHNLVIAAQTDSALTGSHYSTTQGVVMSQAPLFIKSGGIVDVICPTIFAAPDHKGFRLK